MRGVLLRHFDLVVELEPNEFADGGDVLVTPQTVLVGLSKRTSRAGAEALCAKLAELGRRARIAETPGTILHFKTASALLGEDTSVATKTMAQSGVFGGLQVLRTPEGEEGAANLRRVNDFVLIGDRYPRTAEMLVRRGFAVHPLPINEIAKLDAGLSCMSLRWSSHRRKPL